MNLRYIKEYADAVGDTELAEQANRYQPSGRGRKDALKQLWSGVLSSVIAMQGYKEVIKKTTVERDVTEILEEAGEAVPRSAEDILQYVPPEAMDYVAQADDPETFAGIVGTVAGVVVARAVRDSVTSTTPDREVNRDDLPEPVEEVYTSLRSRYGVNMPGEDSY